eukprot:151343-Amphidinium_carterae.1
MLANIAQPIGSCSSRSESRAAESSLGLQTFGNYSDPSARLVGRGGGESHNPLPLASVPCFSSGMFFETSKPEIIPSC